MKKLTPKLSQTKTFQNKKIVNIHGIILYKKHIRKGKLKKIALNTFNDNDVIPFSLRLYRDGS